MAHELVLPDGRVQTDLAFTDLDILIELETAAFQAAPWFCPPHPLDRNFLEDKGKELLEGLQLPPFPITFVNDPQKANEFAMRSAANGTWVETWSLLKKRAEAALYRTRRYEQWNNARKSVSSIAATLNERDQIGVDAARRIGSYLQWYVVKDCLGPNLMKPMRDAYVTGGAIIGLDKNSLGIYDPEPQRL